jgi:hypothetical protein
MSVRSLRKEEIDEVEKVFGPGLDVTRCRVDEGSQFPNLIGRIGAFFRHTDPPEANAITVGNTSYFPRVLTTDKPDDKLWLTDMGWLIHELTHQWQYQHDGIRYLIEAILSPTYVYTPDGETHNTALKGFAKMDKKFRDFNREQQGDIVRDYFWSTKLEPPDADRSGWDSYIQEVRTPAKMEAPHERP